MSTIESIIQQINGDLVPQFEEKLRAHLATQDKDWLIEQIVRLTLDAHSLEEKDRKHHREDENKKRILRIERVKKLNLNLDSLRTFVESYRKITREKLVEENLLNGDAPSKGTDLITDEHRSTKGNELLQTAKDVLFGLLFGDRNLNVNFDRNHRELLTLTMPRFKADALNFMKASTEMSALGTWQDPKGAANDMRADNLIMEVEYGEVQGELIGDGIITSLKLINNLEINEEILYGRMTEIEQSTLVSQKIMKIQ